MLDLPAAYAAILDAQWRQLGAAGEWLTGAERVEIARTTRAARSADGGPMPADPAHEAAWVFGGDPAAPRAGWVDRLEADGLDRTTYVEILGICARVAAIDTFLYGLGQPERPLPMPEAGEPTHTTVADARIDGGFAPTVGPAFPPTALSAVPVELDAMMQLHGALYLSLREMGDLEIMKDLDRRQLELVAARTSLLNDCFF